VYDEKELEGERRKFIYRTPLNHQISLLDPKREAQGKITFEFDHGFDPDPENKFEVSKSGQNVTIILTSFLDGRERARVRNTLL